MTPQQAARLVAFLVAHFPTAKLDKRAAQAFALAVTDLPADEAEQAAKEVIATEQWFPSLARFREIVVRRRLGLPDEIEAHWQVLTRAADGSTRPHALVWEAVRLNGGIGSYRVSSEPARWWQAFDLLYRSLVHRELRKHALGAAGVPTVYEPGSLPISQGDPEVRRTIEDTAESVKDVE